MKEKPKYEAVVNSRAEGYPCQGLSVLEHAQELEILDVSRFYLNSNLNVNANNDNLANSNDNGRIAHRMHAKNKSMKTYTNLYPYLCSMGNLTLAWRKAREEKSNKEDVIEFERDTVRNLLQLHEELKNKAYQPRPLITFVLRDPKTRVISKSDFRDRAPDTLDWPEHIESWKNEINGLIDSHKERLGHVKSKSSVSKLRQD